MIKTISSALAAFAMVTFAGLSGQASAQNCSSCGPAPSISNFGFPAPANSGSGRGGYGPGSGKVAAHFDELKRQIDHTAAINSRIAARNDAWPKPFACWDKRDYYGIWTPMLQAGREINAVLDGNYFTNENELNPVGIDRVRGVVLNSPSNERTVYVNRGADEAVNQARVSAIRHTISTYYAHVGGVNVQLSDRVPQTISGVEALGVLEGRGAVLPPAIIPVGEGGSVDEAVTE